MKERPDMASHLTDFYDRHPISAESLLAKLEGNPSQTTRIEPDELFKHDQDHYGGLKANYALTAAANINEDSLVLDICAGLGGPARYQAWTHKCRIIGIDMHAGRVSGARDLTERTGLADKAQFLQGDGQKLPFDDEVFDAIVSQEAFLHLADTSAALNEAYRVLKPGGRLAFTDWTAGPTLQLNDRATMWTGIAAQGLQSRFDYLALLEDIGFSGVATSDLSEEWIPLLQERLQMYQQLREEEISRSGEDRHQRYCDFYVQFVALAENGALGGARFVAVK